MNIPEDIKQKLINEFDSSWKNRLNDSETQENICAKICEHSGYMLRMFWLGRGDKVGVDKLPLFDWLTKEFVDKELLVGYIGFKPNEVLFKGVEHSFLANEVIKRAFDVYKELPEVSLHKKEISGIRKLFKFMK